MSRCEFRTYHTKYSKKKEGRVTETVLKPFDELQNEEEEDDLYALVIKRVFNEKHELESTSLRVNSPHLLGVFRELVGTSHWAVTSDFQKPFELKSPFQILIHYWDELEKHGKETEDDQIRLHSNLLLDFMRHELGYDRAEVLEQMKVMKITFLKAWVLYRPGDLLYTNVMGHPWLLRCLKTSYEESTVAGPYMTIYCTYTDHDGSKEGTAEHKILIFQKQDFPSDHPAYIKDLPVYPRRFVEDDGLEARLAERGRKLLAHKGVCVRAYNGLARFLREPPDTYYDPDPDKYNGVWLPFAETGRIILDKKTFEEDQWSNVARIKVSEPEHILCPPYAMGYSLSRKNWCQFFVDNTSDVEWKQDVWKQLVLDLDKREVLEALVSSHQFPSNARDQPEQKGKGLVILLHGSPGSGKTLTAETAAEGSRRALISASLGELNKDNRSYIFEFYLRRLLQYATAWGAVVLLDEADTFLEARAHGGDAERNALVAIFLKELEYFSGVVFLTTNRLATFDTAMKSRIHLALGYDPPDLEIRRQVWMQMLQRVPEDELGIEDVDDAVMSLLPEKLNGREISNAINTARTIARFQKRRLGLEDIEKVLGVRQEFDKSLTKERKRLGLDVKELRDGTFENALRRQESIVMAGQDDGDRS